MKAPTIDFKGQKQKWTQRLIAATMNHLRQPRAPKSLQSQRPCRRPQKKEAVCMDAGQTRSIVSSLRAFNCLKRIGGRSRGTLAREIAHKLEVTLKSTSFDSKKREEIKASNKYWWPLHEGVRVMAAPSNPSQKCAPQLSLCPSHNFSEFKAQHRFWRLIQRVRSRFRGKQGTRLTLCSSSKSKWARRLQVS